MNPNNRKLESTLENNAVITTAAIPPAIKEMRKSVGASFTFFAV